MLLTLHTCTKGWLPSAQCPRCQVGCSGSKNLSAAVGRGGLSRKMITFEKNLTVCPSQMISFTKRLFLNPPQPLQQALIDTNIVGPTIITSQKGQLGPRMRHQKSSPPHKTGWCLFVCLSQKVATSAIDRRFSPRSTRLSLLILASATDGSMSSIVVSFGSSPSVLDSK